MHNTEFLVVFVDLCEQGSLDNIAICHAKVFFFFFTMEVNGNQNTLITKLLENHFFVFLRRKKLTNVWNDMEVRKW